MDWKNWGDRLRTLRLERGLTQQELGGRLGVSRNTVNRWEIGGRRPSSAMQEKLAHIFNVTIHALLHDRLVAVKLLTFDVARAFPLTDRHTVPVIRLMMATDDARHLQKLLIIARERAADAPPAEEGIINGELGHLFRLLCGHLHEAKGAFLALEGADAQLLDAVVRGDKDGVPALKFARAIYREKPPRPHQKVFLDAVRNFVAFHYNDALLRRALQKHIAAGHLEGSVTLSPHAGIGRYTMTDRLATLLLSDELGGQLEGFQERFADKVGVVIALAGALGYVVDLLVGRLVLDTDAGDVKTEEGVVRVDPLVERARRAVMAARKSGGTR